MAHKISKYEAILIDTSTFENHGLRFDSGLLADLAQFKRSPVALLLPDVIKREIESHLFKKISQTKSDALSKLKNAGEYLDINQDLSLTYYNHLISIDSSELAKRKVHDFVKNTGAIILTADEHTSISNILENYFSYLPPFQDTGSKKNEFPDAIALLTTENWAQKNKKNVLVVSSDTDWENYCKTSKRLVLQKNLSQALDFFNKINAPHLFIEKLENFIRNNNNTHIHDKVLEHLSTIKNDKLQINAQSHLDWHLEESTITILSLTLIPEIKIIRIEQKHITIELSANLELEITARFRFTLGDYFENDLKQFGSATRTVHTSHTKRLLIAILNPHKKNSEDLNIVRIQQERYWDPIPIDFGKIEPNT